MANKSGLSVQTIQTEKNYNIISENIDIYPADYSFPIKTGDTFPDVKLKDRADRSLTNRLLFKNNYDKIFSTYFQSLPEIDITYGFQIRDITAEIPHFYKVVSGYTGLCIGNGVLFDFPDAVDASCDTVVSSSNINEALKSIVEGDFMDACNLYKVNLDNLGNPIIEQIPTKNFIVYNDPQNLASIYSYLTFSVINNRIEFIEYIYNGKIRKLTFAYDGSKVGKQIGEIEETVAFNGKYAEAPVILFKNNVLNLNDTYGADRFSQFDSAVLAVCKAFMNLLRLDERCREIIRKVPDSAISRNGGMFWNRGTISYNENTESNLRPDIEYITPELKNNIEACIEVYKQAVKTLAMASGLSHIFFDFERAGTGVLSGKALESMMMPTLIEVNKLCTSKEKPVKELVRKICLLKGIDTPVNKIDVDFNQGLPKDEKEQSDIVEQRLKNNTISLVDAIRKLDRVPMRIAREQANNILGLLAEKPSALVNNENKTDSINDVNDLTFSTNEKDENPKTDKTEDSDAIADVQLAVSPRDYIM